MLESYSWLGVTVALFCATLVLIAVVMLAIDIYREWKFRKVYRKSPQTVGRWEKVGHTNRAVIYSDEALTQEEVDLIKASLRKSTVYDWKKDARNDFN